ncbi:MAG: NAD(P)/FAD-dependent oxidoreductase [Halobacteriota archaeon]
MTDHVVVIGAGYAGAGAVKSFEERVEPGEAKLTWISERDYHLVLHEVHRAISNPGVESKIAIPIDEIKSDSTDFIRSRVTGVDTDDRSIQLEDGDAVSYDYLLVAIGSRTAFFGISGLREHSHTLKSLDDARAINEAIRKASDRATRNDPAQVLIGGAGLSGIQTAGEIAEYRDEHRASLDIKLVEGLDEIFPGQDPEVQGALKKRLLARDVEILTGEFISEVDDEHVYLGADTELAYDVLVWTGGITGREEIADSTLEKDDRSHRLFAASDFQTSDDRVFAIGDSALIDQGTNDVAPPTAQAAWQAAAVAGENLLRASRGSPLKSWQHEDKGTVVSVGEDAVAHDVQYSPINTFGGPAAKLLKKAIATRWIADVSSPKRAMKAFSEM